MKQLTSKSLKLNKKRTIVTIMGIILATSLITGVAGLAESFRATLMQEEKRTGGDYHYAFLDVRKEDLKYIQENRNIESYYTVQKLGYAKCKESQNEDKPFLYLLAMDQKGMEKSNLNLTEGRLPEQEDEIVISQHMETNGKIKYEVGQTLTLALGERRPNDSEFTLGQSSPYNKGEETFTEKETKSFKIVGVIERPSTTIEPRVAPGYSVICKHENLVGEKADIYTRYTKKGMKHQDEVTEQIVGLNSKLLKKERNGELFTDKELEQSNQARYDYKRNRGLLRWENMEMNDSTLTMMYSVCSVVIVIIIVTSVFCIRNSFAISITEKMKQYGMLSSIGATSKQIKKNVLYEARILAMIGIPIGILGGNFAVFVLTKVVGAILQDMLFQSQFMFATSIMANVLAIVLAGVTIYLSAISSAKKAAKVSPIEAIRNSGEIKIKGKKVKSPKWIKKVFGLGGEIAYKTLKRNKKKYRTTVVSIVVSVAIFIAMSSFIGYAFKTSSVYYKTYSYNLVLNGNQGKEVRERLQKIAQNEKVERASLTCGVYLRVPAKEVKYGALREENMKAVNASDEDATEHLCIMSIGKEEYARYLKKLGLTYEQAKDKAILYDNVLVPKIVEGKRVYHFGREYGYQEGDKITGIFGREEAKRQVGLEVVKVTQEPFMSEEGQTSGMAYFVVSDEWLEAQGQANASNSLYIQTKQANALQEELEKAYSNSGISIFNVEENVRQEKAMWLVVAIFLYGFMTVISLIGVTNIFNTITTNMNLRKKEFAMLRSIGMTSKEFKRMIRLESLFYGLKSLCIGVPIGIVLSFAFYKSFAEGVDSGFNFPTSGTLISALAVFILIGCIMHYSLKKIEKQNIIETIRQDNI